MSLVVQHDPDTAIMSDASLQRFDASMLSSIPVGRSITDQDIADARNGAIRALQLPPSLARMVGLSDERDFENVLFAEWRTLAAKAAKLTMKPLATGHAVVPPFPTFMKFERKPPAPSAATTALHQNHHVQQNATNNTSAASSIINKQQQQQQNQQNLLNSSDSRLQQDGSGNRQQQHSGNRNNNNNNNNTTIGSNISPHDGDHHNDSVFDTPPEFTGLPNDHSPNSWS